MNITRLNLPRRLQAIGRVCLLGALAGCDGATAPTTTSPAPLAVHPAADPGQKTSLPPSAPSQAERIWEVYYIQGKKVGSGKTVIENVEEAGQALLRVSNQSELTFQRGGQENTVKMQFVSWETKDGKLVRFTSKSVLGDGETAATGKVADGRLTVKTQRQGKPLSQTLEWPGWGGYYAVEQSLRRTPLKPGEKRTIRCLQQLLNIPADVTLTAGERETVKLPSGEQKLLKVATSIDLGGQKLEGFAWMNDRGDLLKSLQLSLELESFRSTESAAALPSEAFDLFASSVVPVKGNVNSLRDAQRATLRARVKDGKIAGVIPPCLSQRIKPLDERTVEAAIISVRPGAPAKAEDKTVQPTDDDLAPNSFVESDDAEVRKLALAIAPDEKDAWKLACALENGVRRFITRKNFSQAFASAAEVVRSREGDCTEHAVLLAACCRCRKIPARVAAGLIYFPPAGGFAYHMWNEVWIADRWIPLDATLGRGGIGCDHLKITDTNLKGADAYTAMLPIAKLFNRLELEVLKVE